jgi:hypothetical protein
MNTDLIMSAQNGPAAPTRPHLSGLGNAQSQSRIDYTGTEVKITGGGYFSGVGRVSMRGGGGSDQRRAEERAPAQAARGRIGERERSEREVQQNIFLFLAGAK